MNVHYDTSGLQISLISVPALRRRQGPYRSRFDLVLHIGASLRRWAFSTLANESATQLSSESKYSPPSRFVDINSISHECWMSYAITFAVQVLHWQGQHEAALAFHRSTHDKHAYQISKLDENDAENWKCFTIQCCRQFKSKFRKQRNKPIWKHVCFNAVTYLRVSGSSRELRVTCFISLTVIFTYLNLASVKITRLIYCPGGSACRVVWKNSSETMREALCQKNPLAWI